MKLTPCSIFATAAMAIVLSSGAWAADEPAVDAAKYPQDTAKNSIASIIKALEGKDYGYYLCHLIHPIDKERILKKYKSVDDYVKAKSEAEQSTKMTQMAGHIKTIESTGAATDGETKDGKWVRYTAGKDRLQLEALKDGRWVMNLRTPTEPETK